MAGGILKFFSTGADLPEMSDRAQVDSLYKRHRFRVMLAITLGYGLIYTCRLALGVVKKPLIDSGIYSPSDLGMIGSALFYTYAIGKLTNGFLADHANMKRFLAFAFLATALCNLAMGFTTALWAAVMLWGLNGWFQSFGAPGGVVAMTSWFSNRERGRAYGLWSTAHSIGEGLTFLVVGSTVAALGWRWGFWGPGLIGVATAIGCFALIQDRPRTMGLPAVNDWKNDNYGEAEKPAAKSVIGLQLSILRIPAIWVLCLASALTYVTRYAINSWGVLYLQEARGFSLPAAGTLLMVSTLAGIVGAIAFGLVSDKVFSGRRPPANLLFGALELIGLLLIFFGPASMPVLVTGMLLFGMGMTGMVTSLGGLFAVDIAPKRVAGAAMGVIGIFSYIGAGIQEQVSGLLIEKGMTVIGDVRSYDFGPVIWFWIGCSVLATLLATSLWRTKLRD
ncbi:MFS transporter [Pseudoxanthomonas yeongjuensis]|uniref:MFS transporter n=1 Tax=Pseudoxanthomonas yeongjuensis TaxID=377616 RepID=UPI001B86783C|nr:MFS transporter [Pseudoxanthomonas yeongjuensis]